MPVWIRTLVITALLIGTVTGWAAAIFLGTQVLPNAQLDDADLGTLARSYVTTYVEVQREADEYERLSPFLAGPALEAAQREADAGAEPVDTLELSAGEFEVVWRNADQALVAANLTLTVDAIDTKVGEHYLMQLVDGRWRIVQRWRLQLDPGTPIVAGDEEPSPSVSPVSSGVPTGSGAAAPTESPAASETPAESPAP